MKRIVITGMGAITPIGNDVKTFWKNLVNGVSGSRAFSIENFDESPVHIACEVQDFDPTDFLSYKLARQTSRSTHFAIASTAQALEQAQFDIGSNTPAERVGMVMNTGGSGMGEGEEATRLLISRGPRGVGPFYVPRAMPNAVSGTAAIVFGIKGPVLTSTLACASGNYALVEAAHYLQRGEADVMIAGGTESAFVPIALSALDRMGALTKWQGDPAGASRPFDATRDGFVYGEGAAALVLETEEHALRRGAEIYGEVLGGALTADAFHISAPDPGGDGAVRAMQGAIQNAEVKSSDIDVVFAHGTSTPLNDLTETKAIKTVFNERAYDIPITATKSMIGHAMGAAGALSAVAAICSMGEKTVPPTINYETPDPDCDLDYVPNTARELNCKTAMVNAFGFGGHNVALLLGNYHDGLGN